MVTYFNKKDLVSFGNYLLSKERTDRINESYKKEVAEGVEYPYPLEERLSEVHHADIENWLEFIK